ncbi:retrotransposon protein, putative, ty1-copia subclass [Tanacetum coccineum]
MARDRERRIRTKPLRFQDESNMAAYAFAAAEEEDTHEPLTYQEAVACEDNYKWKVAMKEEMDSLRKNKTWELVDSPAGQKLVSCKWLFKIKEGIEVRHTSIRVILALTACKDYELEQLDVKTAFLHGNLEEVIYMKQPPDMNKVTRSYAPGEYIYLLLYVDDMLIACKSKAEIGSTKSLLKNEFDIKELGEAKKILGMEIVKDRSRKILRVSQSGYVSKILNNFRIDNGKSVKMPLGGHFKLSLKDCPVKDCDVERMSKVPYANAVGILMYLMVCTRPDIAYAVSVVSRYLANLSKNHWEAVKWILKYLWGTATVGLVYGTNHGNHVDVTGFVDSDYAKDLDKALSTIKAEYTALTEAVKEAIWLRGLLEESGVELNTVALNCDNQGAIHLSWNHVFHERTKHINVRYHFIREALEAKTVKVLKVGTKHNDADALTKVVNIVLENIEVKFKDEDLALLLLTSLPASYEHFVDTLLYGREALTLEDVMATLNSKEIKEMSKVKGDDGEGLYVRGRTDRRDSRQNCPKNNRKKSTGYVKKDEQPSSSGSTYDDSEVMMVMSTQAQALLDLIMDSGCSYHMTPRLDILFDFLECDGGSVQLGDNRECKIRGIGKVRLQLKDGSSFVLHNVRYIPELKRNLISLGTLEKEGYTVKMQSGKIKVINGLINGSRVILSGIRKDNCVYSLDGHAMAGELNASVEEKDSLARVWVYILKFKHEAFGKFKEWKQLVENQTGRTIKKLSTNNGLELCNRGFRRYIPKLKRNLISLGTLVKEGYTIKLQSGKIKVINGSTVVLSGTRRDNCVYSLDGRAVTGELNASVKEKDSLAQVWHKRLGRISEAGLHVLEKQGLFGKKSLGKLEFCENCVLEKLHRVSFSVERHTTQGGKRHFLSIIDDYSKRKLRTDNGLEFCNWEFKQLCIKSGIARHLMSQQNGLAECLNRTIMDKVHSIEKKTPMEMWSRHPSDYRMLRTPGCVAYSHVKQGKLKLRMVKCVLLGYPEGVKGYRLYRLDNESPKIVTSRNVVFNESVMYKDTLKDYGAGADKSVEELQVEVELQREQRIRTKPLRFRDESNMATYAFVAAEEEDTHEPLTYYEAVACEDSSKWKAAMKEEMDSLRKNKT